MAGGDPRERTSLIVTVLDEAASIDRLLESIEAQTRPPDEIVIVDGGSTDGTWDKIQRWNGRLPVRSIRAEGLNISAGRNAATVAATGDLIAVTDAGVRLEPTWLERLLAALEDDVNVVGGFFKPDPCTTFERAMGATVLPLLEDVVPEKFLPSSRSVLFRRRAWDAVGGYPEWLDYCEDLVFDFALKASGFRFAFAPEAVAWFRPRGSLGAFFRQYYRYARGDGKANLWLKRHLVRYLTYAMVALILRRSGLALVLLLAGGLAYTRRPYQRLDLAGLSATQRVYAIGLVPVVRLVGDVAKMLGYPVGVAWRFRHSGTLCTSRSSS
jgi:glycosyltransferase involved in cell wall biosynthesis